MPGLTASPMSEMFEREIARFIEATSAQHGEALYRNRRDTVRYHRSQPVLVSRVDEGIQDDIAGTLQDVSKSGLGFICDFGFPAGSILCIKLFWQDPSAPRVPAVVRRVNMLQEGILIGAQFATNDQEVCQMLEHGPLCWYG